MDTITHGIAGAVIAKAGFSKRLGRIGTVAGIISAVIPDADFIFRFFGEESFLRHHRGVGNSVFLMFPIAFLLTFIFNRFSKKRAFWTFFLLVLIEMAGHNFLDLQTSFGTMLLYPFSDRRFSLDLVFIIDLYYTGLLIAGLVIAYLWKKKGEAISIFTLLTIILYTGLCAYNHSKSISLSKDFASNRNIKVINVSSLPQPLSPFYWANYIDTGKEIYQGFVDLKNRNPETIKPDTYIGRFNAKFKSPENVEYKFWLKFPNSIFVDKALNLDGVKFFLWFSRFPVLAEEKDDGDFHILRFFDLQFGTMEDRYPFLYEVVFDRQGNVISQKFINGSFLRFKGKS
ncbi:MAG: metal-dependent hydrolase [Nitrospirota bacterium]